MSAFSWPEVIKLPCLVAQNEKTEYGFYEEKPSLRCLEFKTLVFIILLTQSRSHCHQKLIPTFVARKLCFFHLEEIMFAPKIIIGWKFMKPSMLIV